MGDAILPSEVIVVPEGPKKTKEDCAARKEISEAAPSQLACIGKSTIHSHDRKPVQLHPNGCAGEESEEAYVEEVNKAQDGSINYEIDFEKFKLAAQRAEHDKESAEHAENHGGID